MPRSLASARPAYVVVVVDVVVDVLVELDVELLVLELVLVLVVVAVNNTDIAKPTAAPSFNSPHTKHSESCPVTVKR